MRRLLCALLAATGCDAALVPAPLAVADAGADGPAAPAAIEHVLYANFEGAMVHGGACSDAIEGCSSIVACPGPVWFPAYTGTAAQRTETLRRLAQHLRPYAVRLVTARPERGDYSMILFGGTASVVCAAALGPVESRGLAPLDCGDANPRDVTFVFTETAQNDPFEVAAIAAQEHAHSCGLEHTADVTDLMYPLGWTDDIPPFAGGDPELVEGFVDHALPVVEVDYRTVSLAPARSSCDGSPTQSSHRRLLAALGAGAPDTRAPEVSILEPADGAFRRDSLVAVEVRVSVEDDWPIASLFHAGRVEMWVDGKLVARDGRRPVGFDLHLPAGPHVLVVRAADAAGNVGVSAPVRLTLGN